MIKDKNNPWYVLQTEDVLLKFKSSAKEGLTSKEIQIWQKKYGFNELPKTKLPSFPILFFRQFKSPLIYLLLIASAVASGLGHHVDAQVIFAVLMLNALIGSIQERRAQISMEALKNLTRTNVRVLRNQQEELIDSKELVPGDILLLNEGDAVGADARLISVANLQASEASLTGESMPLWKTSLPLPIQTAFADRTNMVYAGTHITKGKGKAVVVATGVQTEVGLIASLAQTTKKISTPLEEKIASLSKYILIAAFFVFSSVLLIGVIQKISFSAIFMTALSQVVSMVPEGLPVAMTVALAVGMQRMARCGAIVRKLDAVETLGSTNVICTDKTGTLTRNEMTVTEMLLPFGRRIKVTGVGYSPVGEFVEQGQKIALETDDNLVEIFKAAALCNDAKFILNGNTWKTIGDPTEVSLLTLVKKSGSDPEEIRGQFTRIGEIPFDSETKMMAVLVEKDGVRNIYIKGAPEAVLGLCSTARKGTSNESLNSEELNSISQEMVSMATEALRLLAFAVVENSKLDLSGGWSSIKGHARFLGVVGQFDPPRSEVRTAVHACRSAGIRPVIVTGDHKVTGFAIARMLDIASPSDIAIDGQELAAMSEEELYSKLHCISVFARVHPEQKLRIVKAWQKHHAVVAMTGDGVNDAPALVKADVGVAMGITGTEVAKEAAKIVISDDNFATIVQAVKEGRIVFRNLRKLLIYLMSTGITELVVLYVALLCGLPLPLAAVQILWINLVTDGILSLPLILEPSEGDEMEFPPISREEPLISRELLKRMAFLIPSMAFSTLFYFIYRLSSDIPFAQVQTGTFTVLAVCQWLNALNCRSEKRSAFHGLFKNRWFLISLFTGNLLHMGVVFLPILNLLFHTAPMPLSEVFLIGSVASLVLWVEEIRKFVARRTLSRAARIADHN